VLADGSFPRDCSNTGSDDVQHLGVMRAELRRSFAACRSRSRAARIEGLSAAGERTVWPLWRPVVAEREYRARRRTDPPRAKALHALDPDEHLIKVPLVAGPRRTAAQVVGEALTKFLAPSPNGLIGDDDAPLGQQKFNISKAEAEYVIQPDGMGDEFGWKPMTIVRVGRALHPVSLAGPQPECQTRLT